MPARGSHPKALAKRESKAEQSAAKQSEDNKRKEDAKWADDDKGLAKKNQRKEEKDKKAAEALAKRQELKRMEEEEKASLTCKGDMPPAKVSQYQIQLEREKKEAAALAMARGVPLDRRVTNAPTLVENLNRHEDADVEVVTASGLDNIMSGLGFGASPTAAPPSAGGPKVSMAAAYKAFEEQRMPSLKKEFPNMKLSQLKQKLRKEWQRCPSNPLNMPR